MQPEALYGPTQPAPRCEAHDGAHSVYEGSCIAMGAQVERPFTFAHRPWSCPDCGVRVHAALGRRTLRPYLCDEATMREHVCRPPARVALDEDVLAAAIVKASAATRADRRQVQAEQVGVVAPTPAPARQLGDMRTVDVWADDGAPGC